MLTMFKKWKARLAAKREHAQHLAWLCRASFESGYRNAGGGDEWRDEWKKCKQREQLKAWGYISEQDGYR